MDFEVLINDSFLSICTDTSLKPLDNKHVLSIINDFEDHKWRFKKFQNFIWDNIAETALSYRERNSLVDHSHSLLTEAAQNLRLTDKEDDIGKGSELAEIVLYGIMKHYYRATPVVPKIFYKQNVQDNAKGADSVHIVIEGKDNFSIWFGEAKFYKSLDDTRLSDIVASVGNSLRTDKLKKENSIITNISDLNDLDIDDALKKKIKESLSNKNSIDNLKSKIHIPILLLHECEITKKCDHINDSYKEAVIKYHRDRANSYFKKQVASLSNSIVKYACITFHIVLFPVPCKKTIVDKFIANVEHYKDKEQ